jgi:hypothetical protein
VYVHSIVNRTCFRFFRLRICILQCVFFFFFFFLESVFVTCSMYVSTKTRVGDSDPIDRNSNNVIGICVVNWCVVGVV